MALLTRPFFEREALAVAPALLGKILVHGDTAGVIVETEAYMGRDDRGSHCYGGRRTARTETMYGPGGHAYVYLIYGMYCCLNVVCAEAETAQCVLIRALEPVDGLALMRRRRAGKPDRALCAGPGRLCMALDVDRRLNGRDMTAGDFHIREGRSVLPTEICASPRVGLDYAGEARDYPWRYYIKGNTYVSKAPKPKGLKT